MNSSRIKSVLSLMIIMVLIVPTINSQLSMAGSSWIQNSNEIKNNTFQQTIVLGNGISLDKNTSLLNDWYNINYGNGPPARHWHAMAYDSDDGVIILFGGYDKAGLKKNDTWAYNVSTGKWKNMNPSNPPTARVGHAMAYDCADKVVILYGGTDMGTYFGDTWAYNYTTNTWTNRNPSTPPPGRADTAMVYDILQKKIIIYGGSAGGTAIEETKVYDYSTNSWSGKSVPSTAFGGRDRLAMAYDTSRGITILFGGFSSSGNLADTWAFNLSTNTWTNKNAVNPPPARYWHSMAYDSIRKETIVFGGTSGNYRDDTWTYNFTSNTWSEQYPTVIPSARDRTAMIFDPISTATIMFGGNDDTGGSGGSMSDLKAYNYQPYHKTGTSISTQYDTNGSAYFGSIDWTGTTPSQTGIHVQFKTADTKLNLNTKNFLGPDGTTNTYYTISGQKINSKHNGSRWMQYELYLNTSLPLVTPTFNGIKIKYNLLQNLSLTSPIGGENWTSIQNITWNATDSDNDKLNYTIFLESNSSKDTLASGLTGKSWQWDTKQVKNGTYRIEIVSYDDNISIPLHTNKTSSWFTIHHPKPNSRPSVTLLHPNDGSVVNKTTVQLSWKGEDLDNDTISYFIFLDNTDGKTYLNKTSKLNINVSNLIDNKTYYWTVIPNDGKINGTAPTVWSFSVNLTPPNNPPQITSSPITDALTLMKYIYHVKANDSDSKDILTYSFDVKPQGMTINKTGLVEWTPALNQTGIHPVGIRVSDGMASAIQWFNITVTKPAFYPPQATLISPSNGTVMNITTPMLSWSIFDPDSNITYSALYLSEDQTKVLARAPSVKIEDDLNSTSYIVKTVLQKGKTYYWTIIPNDGTNIGKCVSGIWWFKISQSATLNHAPVFTNSPIKSAVVGKEYRYDANASDEDGDTVVFSLVQHPAGMSIDSTTGMITWTPNSTQIGMVSIILKASDGTLFTLVTFEMTVSAAVINHKPVITAIPDQSIKIGKEFKYQVLASDTDTKDVLYYSLKQAPQGIGINSTGFITWKSAKKDIGTHTITVNVSDNKGGSAEISFNLKVEKNPASSMNPFIIPFIIILIIVIIISIAAILIARKRKLPKEQPGSKAKGKNEDPKAEEKNQKPEPATIIDDIFLIYKDGRLITHHTRKLKPEMDDDVLGGMFTAVQEFIKTSFGGDEETPVDEISYGKNKILIEHGKYIFISPVIEGRGSDEMHERMKIAVQNIEVEFEGQLKEWSGDVKDLKDAKKWLKAVISGEPIQRIMGPGQETRPKMDQFNVETERKAGDGELDMTGKKS